MASARPETAAISTASLPIELAGKGECLADIQLHGLGGSYHAPEQAGFGLVFDISYGQWTDPQRSVRRQLDAIRHRLKALNAGWRHRIGVGDDQKTPRGLKLRPGQDAHAGASATERHLHRGEDCGLFLIVTAVGRPYLDTEARLDFAGTFTHAFDAVITHHCDIGAFERGDRRGCESDNTRRTEHRDFRSLQAALFPV